MHLPSEQWSGKTLPETPIKIGYVRRGVFYHKGDSRRDPRYAEAEVPAQDVLAPRVDVIDEFLLCQKNTSVGDSCGGIAGFPYHGKEIGRAIT